MPFYFQRGVVGHACSQRRVFSIIVQFSQFWPGKFVQNVYLTIPTIGVIMNTSKEIREVSNMIKTLVFDLDGTLANLYGVEGWLKDLRAENPRPYIVAEPMVDIDTLNMVCDMFRAEGYKIVVTTWLAKGATKRYDNIVRQAKLEWLDRVGFEYDEIHLVKYGTTKANCTRKYGNHQILVDDNESIRKGWNLGETVNANDDIIEELLKLL